ncbi:hypothetical protein B0H66DRAFT_116440 [Apodospora peruviana]|uniref:Mitochondrial outer membrane protein n=1 Tax=Apodospora peruviana TaxID=516989 RepID=A0AAE0IHP5_9PEZI|nr:hypothetical protein B0H66DRAFT_116440 [Apodospora peruviana]
MLTVNTPPAWRTPRMPPVPRLLQRLFDSVPLVTYEANELPARAQVSSDAELPTLYVFASEEDARLGAPSFNPSCLKWQTFLKISNLKFTLRPSTNHASPTGSLPFLLPPPPSSPSAKRNPIPASKLYDYALTTNNNSTKSVHPVPSLRQEAYQSLIDLPLRNAFLYTLYLSPEHTALLDRLYIQPASSSDLVQLALRHQLIRAAEAEILKSTHATSGGAAFAGGVVDSDAIYREARDALEALASLLAQSETGWFFNEKEPGLFDASVFGYTYLIGEFFDHHDEGDRSLGRMVRQTGNRGLVRHRDKLFGMLWPDLLVGRRK